MEVGRRRERKLGTLIENPAHLNEVEKHLARAIKWHGTQISRNHGLGCHPNMIEPTHNCMLDPVPTPD